jgi:hypothetical protein
MTTRRMGTSNIYVNTLSNLKRLKNVFSTTMISVTMSGSMTFMSWMVAQIAADVCGSFSRIREIGSLAFSPVGSSNPKRRGKDEEAIWQVA